jgi:DNA polymerase (family 10)
MNNAIELLDEIQRLMKLKGENPFKIRAFEKAVQALAGQDDLLARAKAGTLTELPGIGKGIADVLTEFLLHGRTSVKDELEASLPKGLIELTEIPGLGPKKAIILIEELGVHSAVELEYACKENRLAKLKGFGTKTQQKILEAITFRNSNLGQLRLVESEIFTTSFIEMAQSRFGSLRIHETGGNRRKLETVSELEFLIESKASVQQEEMSSLVEQFKKKNPGMPPIVLHYASSEQFGFEWARTTATPEHWNAIGSPDPFSVKTEEEFYEKVGLPWIPPEIRETGEEVKLAKKGHLDQLIGWDGIRGIFHNHTTRSDGVATLEEMVSEAERLGYDYIGISDHSQSAFYAQGLKEDILLEQEKEIRQVQKKHPHIRIFWGIESDILADGSLDYDARILKKFDFVIASVHSRFQMDRDAMTQRILTAIRNPATRFLGHPTGRLLLGRKAYELDMDLIISEAADHGVAIELNANPARLDLDWRWGPAMRKNQTLTSINPDAHDTSGLNDVRFGIAMARKALFPASQVVNSKSVQEVERWLKSK